MEMQGVFSGMVNAFSSNKIGDLSNANYEVEDNISFKKVMSENMDRIKENQNDKSVEKSAEEISTEEKPECNPDEVVENMDNLDDMEKTSGDKIETHVDVTIEILNSENNLEMSKEMFEAKEWCDEVQNFLCEELEIDLDDLHMILEQLGMQIMDMRDYASLQQLVLKVSGEEDKTILLTNEILGNQLKQLYEGIQEISHLIQEEFSISDMELQGQLEQLSQEFSVNDDIEIENTAIEVNSLTMEGSPSEETDVDSFKQRLDLKVDESTDKRKLTIENIEQDKQVEVSKQEIPEHIEVAEEKLLQNKTTKIVNMEVESEKNPLNLGVENEEADVLEKEIKIDFSGNKRIFEVEESSMSQSNFTQSNEGEGDQSLMQRFVEQLASNHVNEIKNTVNTNEQPVQMREIVNQVVEQIKISVKPDTTSMEIQLNPENLGKVDLTVVAKEGHITAHLVTENEITKQALEGQIQQLRETLGQQGLKVDKVEVSVSNFDFSQSNQTNAEEQKQHQRNAYSRNITRSINLNDTVDLSELTEGEQLTRKIMIENGNQVDYTA